MLLGTRWSIRQWLLMMQNLLLLIVSDSDQCLSIIIGLICVLKSRQKQRKLV